MNLQNKFKTGDLIYIPQGIYLYDKDRSDCGFHSIMIKTWYPTLAVYIGKQISSSGYHDVNIEGLEYFLSKEDIDILNFARVKEDVHQINTNL